MPPPRRFVESMWRASRCRTCWWRRPLCEVQRPSVGAGKKPKARACQTIPGARRHPRGSCSLRQSTFGYLVRRRRARPVSAAGLAAACTATIHTTMNSFSLAISSRPAWPPVPLRIAFALACMRVPSRLGSPMRWRPPGRRFHALSESPAGSFTLSQFPDPSRQRRLAGPSPVPRVPRQSAIASLMGHHVLLCIQMMCAVTQSTVPQSHRRCSR